MRRAVDDLAPRAAGDLRGTRVRDRLPPSRRTRPGSASSRRAFPYTETPDQARTHRGGQGRHAAPPADGPAGGRRRRLRQDRGRAARGLQGGPGRPARWRSSSPPRSSPSSTSAPSSAAWPPSRSRSRCSAASCPSASSSGSSSGVEDGSVDILIGTHRILSRDIAFADLGLLVVDEEQRFGVEPQGADQAAAPRGRRADPVRDADPAHPPPLAGRHPGPVASSRRRPRRAFRSRPASPRTTTAWCAMRSTASSTVAGRSSTSTTGSRRSRRPPARVRRLVPRAKVAIGHGQMAERMLERVMLDFDAGRFDVLVCTTIIESGLDIPNTNTIVIARADTFGLAQLYQLRGRVGRSDRRARTRTSSTGAGNAPLARSPASACMPSSPPPTWAPATRSRSPTSRSAGRATSWAPSSTASWPRSASSSTPGSWPRRSTGLRGRRPLPDPAPVRLDLPAARTCPTTTSATPGPSSRSYRRFAAGPYRGRCRGAARRARSTASARCRRRRGTLHRGVGAAAAAERAGVPEVQVDERTVTLKWPRVPDRHALSVALQVAGLRPDDRARTRSASRWLPDATPSRLRSARSRRSPSPRTIAGMKQPARVRLRAGDRRRRRADRCLGIRSGGQGRVQRLRPAPSLDRRERRGRHDDR